MIKLDEDALICDLAETYQIFDYKQLPITKVAVFACGLRNNARIKLLMTDQKVTIDELLLAKISDALNILVWFKTEDGQSNKNRPVSLVEQFMGRIEQEKETIGFESGTAFDELRNRLVGGGN